MATLETELTRILRSFEDTVHSMSAACADAQAQTERLRLIEGIEAWMDDGPARQAIAMILHAKDPYALPGSCAECGGPVITGDGKICEWCKGLILQAEAAE